MESGIYDFDTYYANFIQQKEIEIESKVGKNGLGLLVSDY